MKPRTVAQVRAEIHGDLDRWYGEEYARLAEMLDDLLRAHAHELAETLRHGSFATNETDGAFAASGLIDPEAETC